MNISLIRLNAVVRELAVIRKALERIADAEEADLRDRGIGLKTDLGGPPPSLEYVDEAADWARETIDSLKRREAREAEAAEDTPSPDVQ